MGNGVPLPGFGFHEPDSDRGRSRGRRGEWSRIGFAFAVVNPGKAPEWYIDIDAKPHGPFRSKEVMHRWMRFKGLLTAEQIERLWPRK